FLRQAGAVNVAREQRGRDLPLEIVDAAAHDIDRQAKPLGRGAETTAARDFQENPGRVPVCQAADGGVLAFLLWNAPFCRQIHTKPFRLLNLTEYDVNHNHDGSGGQGFWPRRLPPDRYRGMHGDENPFVPARERRVTSVVSLCAFANPASV